MNAYKYEARTEDGDRISGVIEAYTQDEAISKLRAEHSVVTSITETGPGQALKIPQVSTRIKDKKLALMCRQFSIILGAGLPIVRTVQLVAGQTDDKDIKQMLLAVADDIAAGYGLADSFTNHGGRRLPTTFTETVRAGEESGNLQQVFDRLSIYYEKTSKTKSKVVSSMIYPLFVIGVAIVVIAIIMVFAVPMFKSTFESLGADLPGITKFMINSSTWWQSNWIIVAVIIIAIIIAIKLIKRTDKGRLFFAHLALKAPIFGRINRMNGASQYASTMSIMLSAGLPVISAVGVTARSMGNYALSQALEGVLIDLEAGKRLGSCLNKITEFPELIVEMTSVGEETGSLEYTLGVIADYYDNEVEVAVQRALSILEPTIIIILAVFVVGVLFSVYIPLFTMYSVM